MSSSTSQSFSCLTCRQRKVKCDRSQPCSNCVKAGTRCDFIAPSKTRRRKKKPAKEGLHARLRRYERILSSYGAKVDASKLESVGEENIALEENQSIRQDEVHSPLPKEPQLVAQRGKSRYLENELWSTLTDEFHDPSELFSDASDDDATESLVDPQTNNDENTWLLGMSTNPSLGSLHPPQHIIKELWRVFLENVNPVTKIIHIPSFKKNIEEFSPNVTVVSRGSEALIFAIYFSALNSLDNSERERLIGEPALLVMQRYRYACQQGLANASFLRTTSIAVLQAYVLYLLCSNQHYDNNTMMCLTGVALRIARRIGVHRDGTSLGLSPFETEMRRRLWWQVAQLDIRVSDFCGMKPSLDLTGDTKVPLNINDDDISPSMMHSPVERVGPTEMLFYAVKYTIGNTIHEFASGTPTFDFRSWARLGESRIAISEKDAFINHLESLLEQRYLRYCDPLEPLHFMASLLARTAVCKLRLSIHNPRQFSEKGLEIPMHERDLVFKLGSRILEYGNLIHSAPMLHRYRWLITGNFLWDSFIYTLMELRRRKTGADVDRVWEQIRELMDNYPQVAKSPMNPLHLAVGAWTLNVWEECMAVRTDEEKQRIAVPDYITQLRANRAKHAPGECQGFKRADGSETTSTPDTSTSGGVYTGSGYEQMDFKTNHQDNAFALDNEFRDFYSENGLELFGAYPDNPDWAQIDMLLRGG